MLNLGGPELMIFAKVVSHLISEFKQTDVGPFLDKKGKHIQIFFLIEDLAGFDGATNEIDFDFEVFGRVCPDGFLSMLFDEIVDAFPEAGNGVLPHFDLLFLDFRHQ
jgi:hypothetical protein